MQDVLKRLKIKESDFLDRQGPVDFDSCFVFVLENCRLTEVIYGLGSFGNAYITPATNIALAVVRGNRNRPFKATTDIYRTGPP